MSSNIELHNSYKCYDSIPTPPDGLKLYNDLKQQSANGLAPSNTNNLIRSPSLDSLVNSSEQDKESSDGLSDSDSLCELKNIASCDPNVADKPRKSDIEQLKNIEPAKEPVRKAYLEKSHKSCDYENCGFKKDVHETETLDGFFGEEASSTAVIPSAPPPVVLKNIRRNSVANSVVCMETILEEPIEPKVSVKEILARFETMRETAEVNFDLNYYREAINFEFLIRQNLC